MKMLEGVIFMPSSRKAQRNCSILKINSKMTKTGRKWSSDRFGWPKLIFMTKTRTMVIDFGIPSSIQHYQSAFNFSSTFQLRLNLSNFISSNFISNFTTCMRHTVCLDIHWLNQAGLARLVQIFLTIEVGTSSRLTVTWSS